AALGFCRDRWSISYQALLPYAALITFMALYLAFAQGTPALRILSGSLWALLIVTCLKVSSLVYEMPLIILATSGLTQFIYFARQEGTVSAVSLNIALLIAAILLLAYSAGNKRVLVGNS